MIHIHGLIVNSGIPVPEIIRGKRGKSDLLTRRMKVGDSVFFRDKKDAKRFAHNLNYACKNTKFHQCTRKVVNGWRVWKVKR